MSFKAILIILVLLACLSCSKEPDESWPYDSNTETITTDKCVGIGNADANNAVAHLLHVEIEYVINKHGDSST